MVRKINYVIKTLIYLWYMSIFQPALYNALLTILPIHHSFNIVDKLKIKTTLVNESKPKLTTSKPKFSQQWVGYCCSTPNEQCFVRRRVWRYQRGNQNSYIEEEQTTQWPKEKVRKDKQRSTKHTYKTKNRVTRTPL